MVINQQIITITRNFSIVERMIKFLPSREDKYYLLRLWEEGHKALEYKSQRDFYHDIRTYSKGQPYFFALGYDIVSDKTNLLVDCGATKYVITDESKFNYFDQSFEPGNHFVELADRSRVNNIMLKRGNTCIIYTIAKDTCRCILKMLFIYISQLLNKTFSV